MEDLTKFIKPLNTQTSWADAVDDDSSDDELIVSDSREAFEVDKEIMQKEGVDANSNPVQNSAKVVQGVSFASLLRGKKREENEQGTDENEVTSVNSNDAQSAINITTKDASATVAVLNVPKAPAVNPWKRDVKPIVNNFAKVDKKEEKQDESKFYKSTETAVSTNNPTSFAKVTPGVSFLNKVLAGQESKKPEFAFKLSGAPTKPLSDKTTRNKVPMDLSLDSSRDGLNLLFSQVVKTNNTEGVLTPKTAPTSSFGLDTIKEKSATPKSGLPFVPQQLTDKRVEKRQRQIDIGKSSVGYQNYIQKVPKESRVEGEIRHPTTPNKNEQISKRRFDGKMSEWRRTLHLWDDSNVNPMEMALTNFQTAVSPRTEHKKSKVSQQAGSNNQGIKRKATKTPQGAMNKKKISKVALENVSVFPSLKNM